MSIETANAEQAPAPEGMDLEEMATRGIHGAYHEIDGKLELLFQGVRDPRHLQVKPRLDHQSGIKDQSLFS